MVKITDKPKYYPQSISLLNSITGSLAHAREHVDGKLAALIKGGRWLKAGATAVVYGTALGFTIVGESMMKPIAKKRLQIKVATQIKVDCSVLTEAKREELKQEIGLFIDQKQLFGNPLELKLSVRNERMELEQTKIKLKKKGGVPKAEKKLLKKKMKEQMKQIVALEKAHAKYERKKAKYILRALGTYASSMQHYAPVVVDWAHSLLETALSGADNENKPKKLVFLARDGIGPYEAAKIIKERHPERYGNVELKLMYLSRKVVSDAQAKKEETGENLLIEYAKQEGINQGDRCVLVDIGFLGSMIQPIKDLLHDHTEEVEFAYLVSLCQVAHGFMANLDTKLESVQSAGGNPAVHWLEDTHQGVVNSPKNLERSTQDGKLYPNTLNPDHGASPTCKKSEPASYLIKHYGFQAILDGAKSSKLQIRKSGRPEAWRMASEKMKQEFDKFVGRYKKAERVAFAKHM